MVLGHGVSARVFSRPSYAGVIFAAKSTSLTPKLDALLGTSEFQDLLYWFEARTAVMGGHPYYLVLTARLLKFFTEVRLFLDLRFSEAFGGD